ncbi:MULTISPECIES: bacteriocin [unclassified Bacillus (in: firmicutes)]|uniref:bacteriocin n=1 Tax=unclassified Bacillus (in: firmicutes) TaxID=185979 RepID=UPI0038371439
MKLETLTEKELLEISAGGGNVCDWGILGVGTAASAGYGAAFGTAFGPGIGTAVGAGVGLGIGALGVIYC